MGCVEPLSNKLQPLGAKMGELSLLEQLTLAVSTTYKDDPTSPAVVTSYLKRTKGWYASVVRYTRPFAGGKLIVCKAAAPTLADTLEQLSRLFWKNVPLAVGDVVYAPHLSGERWVVTAVGPVNLVLASESGRIDVSPPELLFRSRDEARRATAER